MANILCYSRNRCTSVEQVDNCTVISTCRLQDTLVDALVEIRVRLPDLEITEITSEVRRSHHLEYLKPAESLQRAVGIRIGPSVLKIIRGLIGEDINFKQLAFMVEECCHGVILSFTKNGLLDSPKDKADAREYYAKKVQENIRLYNRCAAFGPGSPLVEGIEAPK
ncbi:MAG: hypothetical protein SV775_10550 [Thermodesulfobacteriota bacterium]|nr:hypothetical protein [Thermodesulfobacteriota bacterium]